MKKTCVLHSGRSVLATAMLLSLTLLGSVSAQSPNTGTITGRVLNPATGEYLRNATVTVPGTNISTTTGPGGYYTLTGVPAGEAKVAVEYTGLDTTEVTVTVAPNQPITRDIDLRSKDYGDETITMSALVVSTQREGNARAIMQQRVAPNIKKVVSADAMGSVSEGNVGEFLKLMPGVVMDYVEADTRAMRVRGLNPKYSSVLFDGMQVASAGSSNVGTGRAVEFEQLSISSVETVELTKAQTADLPSTVAGTVNLRSKSAFDYKGRRITFNASLAANSYYLETGKTAGWDNERHRKLLPNFSAEFSDIYLDGKLGVYAGFSNSYSIAAQKHLWFFNSAYNNDVSDNNSEVGRVTRVWYQDGPKPTERGNYNLRIDYKASDDLTLYARFDYITYDARFYNRTLNLIADNADAVAPGWSATDMTVTAGRIQVDSNQFMTKEGETTMFTTGGLYKRGNFSADAAVNYSRADNWYGNLKRGHFTDFASSIRNISWRMTRPSASSTDLTFTQLTGPDWRTISNYRFEANSIGWHERESRNQVWSARLDMSNDLTNLGVPQTLKYGVRASLNVLDVKRYGLLTLNPSGIDGVHGNGDDPLPSAFVDTNFITDWDFGGNMNHFWALSPWKMYDTYRLNQTSFFRENTAGNALNRARNNWDFEETIFAAYVSDTFKFGAFDITPGVRYEKTDSEGRGMNSVTLARLNGGTKYDSWLKFLHGNYKFSKNLNVRASYHDAITRADIANLIPGISGVDFTARTMSASNPNLNAERSKTYNAAVEYYFEPVGVVSLGAFYTELKDRQFANQIRLGADGYEGDTQYADFTLNGPINIPYKTWYRGVEIDYQQQLSFLPGVLRGIGVFANHTRLQFDDWAFNTGSAKWTTNGGFSFKYKRFFGRMNWNWVGKLLNNPARTYNSTTNVWSNAAPWIQIYQKDRLVTDINLEYRLTDGLTLFIDGRNILNEPSTYSYYGKEDNFERILKTGGIWMAGIRGKF